MKTSPTRILPSCLLLSVFWVSLGAAQEPPPATPSAQTPPAQTPEQAPAPSQRNVRQPPPPLPRVPDIRQPGESGFWIGINVWFPTQSLMIDRGRAATFTNPTKSDMPGKPKYVPGGEIGIAAGAHNSVRLSYFVDSASGSFTNATDIRIWTKDYPAGKLVATNYRMQHAKVSFDYLTWPFPVERRRFRLRTLWGIQYTNIRSRFNLPLEPTVDSSGNPIPDSSGNPLDYNTNGSKWILSPDLGIGVTQWVTGHFRLEGSATGFTIPRHYTVWETEGSANLRSGHFELRVGARAFHFKTSTQADFYMKGTQASAFAGLRWYSR